MLTIAVAIGTYGAVNAGCCAIGTATMSPNGNGTSTLSCPGDGTCFETDTEMI